MSCLGSRLSGLGVWEPRFPALLCDSRPGASWLAGGGVLRLLAPRSLRPWALPGLPALFLRWRPWRGEIPGVSCGRGLRRRPRGPEWFAHSRVWVALAPEWFAHSLARAEWLARSRCRRCGGALAVLSGLPTPVFGLRGLLSGLPTRLRALSGLPTRVAAVVGCRAPRSGLLSGFAHSPPVPWYAPPEGFLLAADGPLLAIPAVW